MLKYLIDFIEQPLKSRSNFAVALEALQQSALRKYTKKYTLIMPGDWPAQFYVRQNVYSSLKDPTFVSHRRQTKEEGSAKFDAQLSFHNYTASNCMDCPEFAAQSMPTAPVQAIVPSIGPLHVSLNAREDFMINYHDFFKYIYENIFQGSKLADKPKPW